MKKLFKKLGAFLRKTWVWTLLAVLCVALLVWFAGPLLAVDDYKFWEAATARLLTISVLFLIWGLTMVFVNWRAGIRKKAVEDSQDGQARLVREAKMDEQQRELKARFKDALHTLKTSSRYRGRSERWRGDLPWYLVIGPEDSGKTSLLDFSGLETRSTRLITKPLAIPRVPGIATGISRITPCWSIPAAATSARRTSVLTAAPGTPCCSCCANAGAAVHSTGCW